MSTPAETRPGQPGSSSKSPQRRRRHHQPHERYHRTSAIIDDRPDGKPIIFGYGRHMTRREKDHAKRMLAYCALALVVAVSLSIIVVAAAWTNFIYPNQTVATVRVDGVTGNISRNDLDVMTRAYTYENQQMAQQGDTSASTQDPGSMAMGYLQQAKVNAIDAQKSFGVTASGSDIDKAYQTDASSLTDLNSGLSASSPSLATISTGDYKALFVAPDVVRTKVGTYLTRNNPTTAEQWEYARIETTGELTATQMLAQIAGNKNPQTEFNNLVKKSTDTSTSGNGGKLTWERLSDTATDSYMGPALVQALNDMEKTHAKFKAAQIDSTWFVLEWLGHNLKQKLSSSQTQSDQQNAESAWSDAVVAKSFFNPPYGTTTSTTSQPPTSVPTYPVATTAPSTAPAATATGKASPAVTAPSTAPAATATGKASPAATSAAKGSATAASSKSPPPSPQATSTAKKK